MNLDPRSASIVLVLAVCAVQTSALAYSPMPVPDMNYTDLHRAAYDCDIEKERTAVDALPSEDKKAGIDRLDREGYTPLAYAAQNGCIEVAKLLISSGAAVDAAEERSKWTPLLRASEERHADVAGELLAHGAEVNVRAILGQTPLTEAILGPLLNYGPEGDLNKTVRVLLEGGADINLPGQYGRTPLMAAVQKENTELVRMFMSKGADLSAKDNDGKTALDLAKQWNETKIIDILQKSNVPAAIQQRTSP